MCCVLWTRSIVAQNSPPWPQRPSRTHTHTHTHATQAHHRPRRTVHLAIPCYTTLLHPGVPQCTEVLCIMAAIHVRLHSLGTPHAEYIRQSYSVILCHTVPYAPRHPHPHPSHASNETASFHIRAQPSTSPPWNPYTSARPQLIAAPPPTAQRRGTGCAARRRGRARMRARGRLRTSEDEGRAAGGTASKRALIRKMRIQVRGARTPARRRPASQSPFLLARSPARSPSRNRYSRAPRSGFHRRLVHLGV